VRDPSNIRSFQLRNMKWYILIPISFIVKIIQKLRGKG
jgi:hypothetical protein